MNNIDMAQERVHGGKTPFYKHIVNVYNKAEEYFLITALAVTVILIFYQVVMRYVFNNSSSWTEEMSRYLFIWMTWLGTSLGAREHKHIRVELLECTFINRGRLKAKNTLLILIYLIWLFITVFLAIYGMEYALEMVSRGAVSPAMRLPMVYVGLAIPVGCTAVSLRLIYELYLEVRKLLKGGVI